MATVTKAQLRTRVLEKLGVLAAGEAASAEDAAKVDEVIDDLHEQLVQEGIAAWTTAAIPQGLAMAMTQWVARLAAPDFGLANDEPIQIQGETGEKKVRQLAAAGDPAEPIEAVYY